MYTNAGKAFSLEMANVCNNLATLYDDLVGAWFCIFIFQLNGETVVSEVLVNTRTFYCYSSGFYIIYNQLEQGQLTEAKAMYEQTVVILFRFHGAAHPQVPRRILKILFLCAVFVLRVESVWFISDAVHHMSPENYMLLFFSLC